MTPKLLPDANPSYAKRPSVEAYNLRQGYPEYVSANLALADFDREVTIDMATLTVVVE